MYVQNLTIGLEHINQKRWAIPHCVLESYIISASWVCRDEPSLFIWSILWEHGEAVRGQQPQLLLMLTLQVGLMLNICHPFCSCDRNNRRRSHDDIQLWSSWQHPALHRKASLECDTLTPAMSPLTHTHARAHTHTHTHSAAPLFSQISQYLDSEAITSAAAVTAA